MANAKYERIWKLLDEYTFAFDSPLSDEFLCVICDSVLKNPYQSPCGCRFCMECIVKYLNSNEKYCPGSSDDCKDQAINFQGDLHIDYVINRKISQLKVKCPKALCDHWNELQIIGNHINSHKESCPYVNIGCQYPSAHMRLVVDHLNDQVFHHGKLVAESFTNLKNEMTSLTLALQLSKQESENKDNLLIELDNRLNDLQRSHEIRIQELTETIDKCKLENVQLNSQLSTFKLAADICPVKQEDESQQYKEEYCNGSYFTVLDDNYFKSQILAPFKWQIYNFKALQTKGKPRYISSGPFYSHRHGYKLCLTVYPNGTANGLGTYMSVYVHIMSGEFDSRLDWPMKRNLRICLVDQLYGNIYVDKIFRYSPNSFEEQYKYEKPLAVKNIGIGESQYIQLEALYKNSRIYINDSIIMKCYVG